MLKVYIKRNTTSDKFLKRILKKHHIKYDIIYNEYGKPYLKNNPIYFNVSNKDNITVIVVSNKEVGIDIEKITYKPNIIDKICNNKEKLFIKNKIDFTEVYTKKEAYVKCLGIGLEYGLKNVDTTIINGFKTKKYKDYIITTYK